MKISLNIYISIFYTPYNFENILTLFELFMDIYIFQFFLVSNFVAQGKRDNRSRAYAVSTTVFIFFLSLTFQNVYDLFIIYAHETLYTYTLYRFSVPERSKRIL